MLPTGRQIAFAALASLALAGCAKAGASAQRIGNDMHAEGVKMDRKVRSWFDSEGIGQPETAKRTPDTAYCYKSLGDVTCYEYPLAGEDSRLKGKQVPALPAYTRETVYYEVSPLPVDTMDPPAKVGVKTLSAPAATPKAGPPSTGAAATGGAPQELSPQVY